MIHKRLEGISEADVFTYSVLKKAHFSGAVNLQILDLVDPVALDGCTEGFFQLMEP